MCVLPETDKTRKLKKNTKRQREREKSAAQRSYCVCVLIGHFAVKRREKVVEALLSDDTKNLPLIHFSDLLTNFPLHFLISLSSLSLLSPIPFYPHLATEHTCPTCAVPS